MYSFHNLIRLHSVFIVCCSCCSQKISPVDDVAVSIAVVTAFIMQTECLNSRYIFETPFLKEYMQAV